MQWVLNNYCYLIHAEIVPLTKAIIYIKLKWSSVVIDLATKTS